MPDSPIVSAGPAGLPAASQGGSTPESRRKARTQRAQAAQLRAMVDELQRSARAVEARAGAVPEGPITIEDVIHRDGRIVAVQGEIDLATAPRLGDAVRKAATGASWVMVDLEHVAFIDSTGIALLLTLRDDLARDRVRFAIVVGACVLRVLEVSATSTLLPVHARRQAALAAIGTAPRAPEAELPAAG